MTSWQDLNPAYTWTCFDDEKAKVFLEEEFGGEVLTGYERAPIPAQKADIFRLAYLVALGGVYADADDRCLAPIDSFLRRDATLVVHQETTARSATISLPRLPNISVDARARTGDCGHAPRRP